MKRPEPRTEPVPEATSHRLSLLLRSLRSLEAAGVRTASSYEIAARFSLNSAQIRKDLAQFGEFGVRGVGYRVADLKAHLKDLMGLGVTHAIGIAGAGVRAILNFAPVTVPALPGVLVKNLDLTFFLENLSFQLAIAKA